MKLFQENQFSCAKSGDRKKVCRINTLASFVTVGTKDFFEVMKLSAEFMHKNKRDSAQEDSYKESVAIFVFRSEKGVDPVNGIFLSQWMSLPADFCSGGFVFQVKSNSVFV